MIPDEVGVQLHDRATRNLPLSEAEQAQLQQWYAEQDALEIKRLRLDRPEPDLPHLRAQVNEALRQLQSSTDRIIELSSQNEALRRDVAELRRQVAHLLSTEPA